MFLLPRPRRELASALAPTQRRAPPAPPRGRRRDQPRASGERRSAATMRRKCRYVGLDVFSFLDDCGRTKRRTRPASAPLRDDTQAPQSRRHAGTQCCAGG